MSHDETNQFQPPVTGMQAARKGPPSKKPRHVSVVLPAEIWPQLDVLKDQAQDEGLTMSSRQRIGRDGCITALLGWFMTQDYERQIAILTEGVNNVRRYPSYGIKTGNPTADTENNN